jgi:hypothetical protein
MLLIALGASALLLVLMWRSMAMFLLALVVLQCTPLPYIPYISLGQISLHATDIPVFVCIARWSFTGGPWRDTHGMWVFALLVAIGLSGLSALLLHNIPASTIGRDEARPLLYYGLAAAAAFRLRPSDSRAFVRGSAAVVVLSACMIALQEFYPSAEPFIRARIDPLHLYPELEAISIQRIISPADGLAFVLFFGYLADVIRTPHWKWGSASLAVCCLFIQFISYNRSSWTALLIGSVYLLFRHRKYVLARSRPVVAAGVAIAMGLAIAWVGIDLVNVVGHPVSERISSLRAESTSTGTLEQRFIETSYALARFSEAPLFGIGLGAEYREPMSMSEYEISGTGPRFVHVGYIYILLKMGLVGFVAFIGFGLSSYQLSRAVTRLPSPALHPVLREALVPSLYGFAVVNLVSFHLVELQWVIAMAVLTAFAYSQYQAGSVLCESVSTSTVRSVSLRPTVTMRAPRSAKEPARR